MNGFPENDKRSTMSLHFLSRDKLFQNFDSNNNTSALHVDKTKPYICNV